MVVIYCCLERSNNKVLKFHLNISLTVKKAPPSFKCRSPINAAR